MSFASPSLSQLFLQWGPFRHMRVDVARNADLAPYIGCKEYFMPYRNLKPCQARSRKPTLCTAALCWALHRLMRWDGRRWDRILEAILATPLSSSAPTPPHAQGAARPPQPFLPEAPRSAMLRSQCPADLVTYRWWHLCSWMKTVTDFRQFSWYTSLTANSAAPQLMICWLHSQLMASSYRVFQSHTLSKQLCLSEMQSNRWINNNKLWLKCIQETFDRN